MKLLNISFYVAKKSEYEFLKSRHKVDAILFSELENEFVVKHLKLHEAGPGPGKHFSDEFYFKGRNTFFNIPLSLYLFVKKEKPDVLLLHSCIFPFQLLLLRYFLPRKVKIIVQHHSDMPFTNSIKLWLQRKAYSRADAYLFASRELAEPFYDKKVILDKHKVHEMMEGSNLFTQKNRDLARRELLMGTEDVFLWVGRLNDNKDPLTLLRGFNQFKNQGNNFKLYMIYGSTELEAAIKEYVANNDLSGYVELVGKVRNKTMESWYNAADFFVSASYYEGSGYALCEAMACGCIPVITDIPSFRTMTDDGKCAVLYEAGNAEDLSQKLKSLNLLNKAEMRVKVTEQFKKELSYQALAKTMKNLVDSLLKKVVL